MGSKAFIQADGLTRDGYGLRNRRAAESPIPPLAPIKTVSALVVDENGGAIPVIKT